MCVCVCVCVNFRLNKAFNDLHIPYRWVYDVQHTLLMIFSDVQHMNFR